MKRNKFLHLQRWICYRFQIEEYPHMRQTKKWAKKKKNENHIVILLFRLHQHFSLNCLGETIVFLIVE